MKKLWFLSPVAAIFLTWFYYHQWQHWLAYATGSYNVQGVAHNYNFFSGSGSDVSEITIAFSLFGSTVILWRAHTCHRYWWCWRHGHHVLKGTPYKLCTVHHPDDVPTVAQAVTEASSGN